MTSHGSTDLEGQSREFHAALLADPVGYRSQALIDLAVYGVFLAYLTRGLAQIPSFLPRQLSPGGMLLAGFFRVWHNNRVWYYGTVSSGAATRGILGKCITDGLLRMVCNPAIRPYPQQPSPILQGFSNKRHLFGPAFESKAVHVVIALCPDTLFGHSSEAKRLFQSLNLAMNGELL